MSADSSAHADIGFQPLDIVLSQPGLDPHSDVFFISHYDSPILALHLSIKAMCLLGKVTAFLQRSTLPGATIDQPTKEKIRSSPAFVQLAQLLEDFMKNLPTAVKYPIRVMQGGRLDANLLNAHVVPSVYVQDAFTWCLLHR